MSNTISHSAFLAMFRPSSEQGQAKIDLNKVSEGDWAKLESVGLDRAAVEALAGRGLTRVTIEGGPSLLRRAIEEGGTSLRDFTGTGGTPGYFAQNLLVYGRAEQPCFQCGGAIRQKVIGQRSSFYCIGCQR